MRRQSTLVADFLASLGEETGQLAADKHLLVQNLLQKLPAEADDEVLRDALVSILAQNPSQQERLGELFEAARKRTDELLRDTAQPAIVESEETAEAKKWRLRFILPALLLLGALLYGLSLWLKPTPVAPLPIIDTPTTPPVVQPEVKDTFQFKSKSLPYTVGHNIADFQLPPQAPWKTWFAKHWWWARIILFLLFALTLLAWWRYRAAKRRKLIAEQQRNNKHPYIWNIHLDGAEAMIEMGDEFPHTIQVMRRRGLDDLMLLDLPRTISATAERGGLAEFKYKQKTTPTEYLLLIERNNSYNHRARLFDALYKAFQAQEIEIARYFYDSDLRICFDETHEHGIELSALRHRYPQARLMLVGTGDHCIHPATGKLAAFTGIFADWKHRVLLTPRPLLMWGRDERRLGELFTVLPATFGALDFWLSELDNGQDARFGDWKEKVLDAPYTAVIPPDDEDPLPLLQQHFSQKELYWIAACAIYPSLHWDLTLWLGRWLDAEYPDARTPLVQTDRLLALSRLPWFTEGEIPDTARTHLLEWLQKENNPLHRRLLEAVTAELAKNPPPADSVAAEAFHLQIALSEWIAVKGRDKKRAQQLEKEIAQSMQRGNDPDITVLRYLEAPRPGTLDFVVPEAWKKYVHPAGMPALGWKGDWRDLRWLLPLLLVGLVAAFYPWKISQPTCAGGSTTWNEVEYCLDTDAKRLIYEENRQREQINNNQIAQIAPQRLDSLGKQQDSLLAECKANVATVLYNKGVGAYEFGERDTACNYFTTALQYDTSDYDLQRAVAWCKGVAPAKNPWTIAAAIQGQVLDSLGAPLSGVRISGDNTLLTTDAAGRYTLSLPSTYPRKDIALRYDRTGYVSVARTHVVDKVVALPEVKLSKIPIVADNTTTTQPIPPVAPKDTDGDGIPDDKDKCPNEAAPNTTDGCKVAVVTPKDTDGDGIPDEKDKCPTEAAPNTADGCPTVATALEPTMVPVKGGTFQMGCTSEQQDCGDDEKPAHQVTLSDYYIGAYEVTQKQWTDIMGSNPSGFENCDQCPVERVSWDDVQVFLQKLNAKYPGRNYRLPTEAEWEYAARGGGKAVLFGNGKNTIDPAEINFDASESYKKPYSVVGTYRKKTVPVGSLKSPNALGLHDMSGNVYEWCSDWKDSYPSSSQTNPTGPGKGSDRVIRGGSWGNGPQFCRVAYRSDFTPGFRFNLLGFRLARTK